MFRSLISLLHFTRTERLGAFGLATLVCMLFALPKMFHVKQAEPVDMTDFQEFVSRHEKSVQTHQDSVSPPQKPVVLFAFNPNTADQEDFIHLGLSEKTALSILHYREKGGQFRKPEDFQKIYTLNASDYKRLAPYIRIPENNKQDKDAPFPAQYSGGYTPRKFTTGGPVDINRSSIEDWVKLPMIGERRAQQIIRFREALGGFLSVEQVHEVYNLPDSVYQKILPFLELKTKAVHRINLNTATQEDLDRHPYISSKQAMLIVHYREQHGLFQQISELNQIIPFKDPAWLEKIQPYVDVQ